MNNLTRHRIGGARDLLLGASNSPRLLVRGRSPRVPDPEQAMCAAVPAPVPCTRARTVQGTGPEAGEPRDAPGTDGSVQRFVERRGQGVGLFALLLLLAACQGASNVTYDRQRCEIDGRAVTIAEVEAQQEQVGHHLLARQPIHTAVVVAILLLASLGYLDKLALLIAARRSSAPSFAERVRAALERHRPHPVRYFGIVSGAMLLVVVGAGLYVYLDADKRVSERALQQLQFCHLALAGAEAQEALERQRSNLEQLRSTAGSIKALVDGLPPAEQKKAEALLQQLHVAVGNQSRILDEEGAVAQAVAAGSEEARKDFDELRAGIDGLKGLPERLSGVASQVDRLEARLRLDATSERETPAALGAAIAALHKQSDEATARLLGVDCSAARLPSGGTVGEALAALVSRPAPVCKCECQPLPCAEEKAPAAQSPEVKLQEPSGSASETR